MKLQAQHIGFDNAVAILNQGIQAIDSGDSVMDMQDVRKTDSAAVAVVLEWIRVGEWQFVLLFRCFLSVFYQYGFYQFGYVCRRSFVEISEESFLG